MIKLDTEKYSDNPGFLEQEFYLNQTNTILYSHNPKTNVVAKSYKDEFDLPKHPVIIEKIKNGDIVVEKDELTFLEIIKEKNDIVRNVKPTCKTLEPAGFYTEQNAQHMKIPCFNEYTNSVPFIKALKKLEKIKSTLPEREEDLVEYIYKQFWETCPNVSFLIHNLFWQEPKNVIVNFLSFLSVIGYKDHHQDIFYLFKGQSEDKQGQGAGKGITQQFLTELFSGLVIGVNNSTYNATFNSRLQNMKVVIFDEVNFKKMNYEVVKNITGNESLPIEFKGKEAMETKNVSSWLFFTNEYDLLNKLNQYDRRCILIEPNPINNSLESRVIGELKSDMFAFKSQLINEIPAFIEVLSLANVIKPKKPQELKSNSHIRYYTEQNKVGIANLDFYKIFTNKEHAKKFINFYRELPTNESVLNSFDFNYQDMEFFIENKTIFYTMFIEIYNICKQHEIGNVKSSTSKTWEALKERLISQFDYEPYTYEIKPNKANKLSKKFSKSGLQDKEFVKANQSKTKITTRTKKIYEAEILLLKVKKDEDEEIPF